MSTIIKPKRGLEADIPTGESVIDGELLVTQDTRKAYVGIEEIGQYVELGSGGGSSSLGDNCTVIMEYVTGLGSYSDILFRFDPKEETLTSMENNSYKIMAKQTFEGTSGSSIGVQVSEKSKQWSGLLYEPGREEYTFLKSQIPQICRMVAKDTNNSTTYIPVTSLSIMYPESHRQNLSIYFSYELNGCTGESIQFLSPITIPNISFYC